MKVLKPTDEEYNKIVQVHNEENYEVDTNHLEDECSLVCPADKDMEIIKTNGEIHVRKKRIFGFLHSFTKVT